MSERQSFVAFAKSLKSFRVRSPTNRPMRYGILPRANTAWLPFAATLEPLRQQHDRLSSRRLTPNAYASSALHYLARRHENSLTELAFQAPQFECASLKSIPLSCIS